MKKRMLVFLFMASCVPMFSQNFGGTDQINAPIYYNLSTIEGNKKYAQDFYKEVEGSPYIF